MTLARFPRIATTHGVCGGHPTVAGTRMRVSDVLDMLAGGSSEAEIVGDFPYLTVDDVRVCPSFATRDYIARHR